MARRRFALGLLALSSAIAIAGWAEFLFLTDDAYISFRYAANWLDGRGLVWNPSPFLPVAEADSSKFPSPMHASELPPPASTS